MKKLIVLPALLILGCLLFSFTVISTSKLEKRLGYLPAHCDEPIHFQIESQEPCAVLDVNQDTGKLSLVDGGSTTGLCGNYDNERIKVRYSVTQADGTRKGHFIIIDLEGEE
ncbi:hypothetical protein [Psychroserpens luteolus]|uniref:hypothetical protein n=1 Tax=Psychroserpens luteolus TaxID=2855840 RepID=UPI001E43BD0A|nr:hypothetical protein [Psychroserpens luteolus]MCD2259227.1 hypothetical protein [Psychroserpens luteolus]